MTTTAASVASLITTAQDQILASVKDGQDAIVEGFRWVAEIVPPSLVPELPDPAATVDFTYGFAEKALASQREFVAALLEATQASSGASETS